MLLRSSRSRSFFVKDLIKELVSNCHVEDAGILAEKWYTKLSSQYPNEDLGNAADANDSIIDLIRICKIAVNTDRDLVHKWVAG